MNITILDEPELEFAGGIRHVDPRFGIGDYGPADANSATAPEKIKLGIVGSTSAIEGVRGWLDQCRGEIPPKDSHLRNLYRPFPGFTEDHAFRSSLIFESRLERTIPDRELRRLETGNPISAVRDAVDLFMAELEALDQDRRCDVVICARPDALHDEEVEEQGPSEEEGEEGPEARLDFHDLLKARAMALKPPIQVVRRTTWDRHYKPRRKRGAEQPRRIQDEATRAWNLHTALYYKAGGVPWRLPREPSDLTSCFIGVSFFRTLDGGELHTAVAHVFNERGDGVIVRGGKGTISKHDRQPHLSEEDSRSLLTTAMTLYRAEHHNFPAQAVMHKSSMYSEVELAGFRAAAQDCRLHRLELLWLPRYETARLFRAAQNPPLRGTLLSLADDRHIVYTRGSVHFYSVYPGMYVPQPLGLRTVEAERTSRQLATEILALTKMNWNQTQLDGREPVTLRAAHQVGRILKYARPDDPVASRYAHYM